MTKESAEYPRVAQGPHNHLQVAQPEVRTSLEHPNPPPAPCSPARHPQCPQEGLGDSGHTQDDRKYLHSLSEQAWDLGLGLPRESQGGDPWDPLNEDASLGHSLPTQGWLRVTPTNPTRPGPHGWASAPSGLG